ncbi:hypothetical protein CEXT_629731 [Caerostris extrusa]|uniref:Uncharacterized protein n=1 Tax=Caerostris extrusa TaxID=172846 RepID=A0AAV4WR83_CAEEX|nr:hypothetical protein CEXT_629731 [Caerostris extrusa]
MDEYVRKGKSSSIRLLLQDDCRTRTLSSHKRVSIVSHPFMCFRKRKSSSSPNKSAKKIGSRLNETDDAPPDVDIIFQQSLYVVFASKNNWVKGNLKCIKQLFYDLALFKLLQTISSFLEVY